MADGSPGRTRALLAGAGVVTAGLVAWWLMAGEVPGAVSKPSRAAPSSPASEPFASARRAATPSTAPPVAPAADEQELVWPAADAGVEGSRDAGNRDDPAERAKAKARLEAWLERNAAAAAKHVDAFCDESRRLAQVKALAPTPRTRDATYFLAVRVDWENGQRGLLHLPDAVTQHMKSLPPGGWLQLGPADYAGLDFTWLQELLAYDFWSLSADGPLRNSEATGFYEAHLPYFVTLQQWVKLRLARGLREGELAQASVEVRHLADLCGSTSTLIGDLIRVAMLTMDRIAWEAAGQPPPPGTMRADDGLHFRHDVFAATAFLYPGVPMAVREKALGCMVSRCSAMTEAIGTAAAMHELLPDAAESMQWLQAQAPCDPALATKLGQGPPASPSQLLQNLENYAGVERMFVPDAGT